MKVKSIKRVAPRTVYAITTSTGTFIADGLAHHNCYACNVCKYGETLKYLDFMIEKYGQQEVDRLRKLNERSVSYSIQDYQDLIEKFSQKLRKLK